MTSSAELPAGRAGVATPDEFQRSVRDLLEVSALPALDTTQGVAAARSARLLAALSRSSAERDTLFALADRLHRAVGVDEVYDAAMDAILAGLHCQRAAVLLFDAGGVMRFVAARGLSADYRRAVEGHSPWTAGDPSPQPVCLGNVAAAGLSAELTATLAAEGIGAVAFVPLMAKGRLIGKFMAYFDAAHEFAPEELRLATAIAKHVAFGVERGRAAQELALRAAEVERLAAERAQLIDELSQAHRRKDEFLAVLSHELRNPLAPMRAAVELLRAAPRDAAVLAHARDVLDRQVKHMTALVDDLLDVSRIASGTISLDKRVVALADILCNALELSRPGIDAAGHALEVRNAEDGLLVYVDPVRMAQVLANLLNNSVRYTPPGGRIVVEATLCESLARITVRDNGIGIAPEMLPRIFDMFVQGTTRYRPAQAGLGVGLSLARRLVELHHGTLEARSEGPGRGSEFEVRIPLLEARVKAAAARPIGADLSRPAPGLDDDAGAAPAWSTA